MAPGATHHVKVGDAQVAYQVTGDGPIDLVYMLGVGTNFQMWWDYPPFATLLERLASFSRLILFDRRGSGISDPLPAEGLATWESFTDDLRAVLDAAASTTATIFACHDGGPVAMTFAATHPDRVANLVLWDSFARISADADYPIGRPLVDTDEMVSLLEAGWGTEASARYLYGDDIDEEMLRWHMKVTVGACTPASYARQSIFFMGADARSALDLINVPVLVLHEAECHVVPPELGRFVADNVPDARYVELPGVAIDLFNRPDAAEVLDLVEEFVTGIRPSRQSQRVLACVLFTDIVGSTTRAAELGDEHWTTLLDKHDVVSRTAIAARSGVLVKTTGDGVLAIFDGPGRAIQAAIDLRERLAPVGIDIRAGVHFGEIERRPDGDIGGISVHVAARVLALAGAAEILCTRTVKELSLGSGIAFADRGTHVLRGIPDEWQLYAAPGSS